ncbi:hypothetical protein [Streptomyces sp. NPDC020983]|uniref:hypothetical protein n=1 Tax=Streptomyces sp. NPDC020983 TaxID=3365106 RepID=UPI003798F81A
MTHTPTGRQIPDVRTGAQVPAPRGGNAPAAPSAVPAGRPGWAEFTARARAAATTEPGRLRIIGAALAVLVVAFGATTAWQVDDRAKAADNVVTHSAPLSATAAEIYRSLADADATVTAGFLVSGPQPKDVATRYQEDIDTASQLITAAAANSRQSPEAQAQITKLNEQLPTYTSLVATALADNRLGLPIGGAYLRYANQQMRRQGGLLDAADRLYTIENARLAHDYTQAKALPYASWALGVVALGALAWAQRRHYRRTNRVFNQGMLAATAAGAVLLLWLAAGHTVARTELAKSSAHGARSVQVLNNARILVLRARGDENLTLVARGSGDAYESSYGADMTDLMDGVPAERRAAELTQALRLANDAEGRGFVTDAITDVRKWRSLHVTERKKDDNGDYATAVADVLGKDAGGKDVSPSTADHFAAADKALGRAVAHEQAEFHEAATSGRDALTLLPAGAGVLAVLGALGALLGIGRRLSEYR